MMKFLRRHSADLSRRNSRDEDEGSDKKNRKNRAEDEDTDKKNRKNRDEEEKDEIAQEEAGVVVGEDIINGSVRHSGVSGEVSADPCRGLSFTVGVHENKNGKYRRTMEDVHTYVANFCERLDWGYFGIFDGHAGKQTARWAGTNLHNLLYESIINDGFADFRENLNESFLKADEEIAKLADVGSSGSTAAVAVLRWEEEIEDEEAALGGDGKRGTQAEPDGVRGEPGREFDFIPSKKHKRILYTANVGDSRIVLNRKGKAIRLSYDHKGTDKNEIKRIYKSGGLVLGGRVNGVLAVSRSLGDVYLKEFVLGKPFTTMTEIKKGDRQLIVACDGLWDVCEDDEAVELISDVEDCNEASRILCDYAIKNGTGDNVTVMVVNLNGRVFDLIK